MIDLMMIGGWGWCELYIWDLGVFSGFYFDLFGWEAKVFLDYIEFGLLGGL